MKNNLEGLYVDVTQILRPVVDENVLTDIVHSVLSEFQLMRAQELSDIMEEVVRIVDVYEELETERERADRNEKALVAVIGMYRDIVEISRAQEQYDNEIKQLEEMEKNL